MIREKKKSPSRRIVESSNRHDCPLCKSFGGRWTAEEAVAFNEVTQRTVDEEDWQ